MRVLIVGLGGGGCRLVDSLYAQDQRFGAIHCLSGLAVDNNAEDLNGLEHVPKEQKIFFQPLYPGESEDFLTAIPIEEVIAKIQSLDSGDIDAIILCAGMGGTGADIIPELTAAIRKSMYEPVFGLFILPCSREGSTISAKAALQIDAQKPELDGVILFDNQTWFHKIADQLDAPEERSDLERFLPAKRKQVPESRRKKAYRLLNEVISRRIGLILRAGEFNERGRMEIAEVVLDAGEVLNTIKGMGFITIGYAVAQVDSPQFDLINRLRSVSPSIEEGHKKALRVVELAKKAIYEEISTPCDLSTAHKALILIAGPSHEMSMKGFMMVRKWIDRSIRGLEVRSGDYPVNNTGYLSIIIILAGLENIPRLDELRAFRNELYGVPEHASPIGEKPDSRMSDPNESSGIRTRNDDYSTHILSVGPSSIKKEDREPTEYFNQKSGNKEVAESGDNENQESRKERDIFWL
ncbi:MAG TPA: tubulin/FtsZ family protein [Methanoregulaceae archaeon]|nr:tubulin/FtsZ family protein [Methanoregulaceae archaeon]